MTRPVSAIDVAVAVFSALIANPDHFLTGMRVSLGIAAVLLLLTAVNSARVAGREAR